MGAGGRVGLAIGVAGSGKSTLLKPLVRAWQADGRVVHGIALAWRQSDDLAEAGIAAANTRAVTAFLRDVERGKLVLGRKSVVVVDEVGLLGTRQLNAIMATQAEKKFQLVMIGDPKQMQAVEAGPVIELLRRALGIDKVSVCASAREGSGAGIDRSCRWTAAWRGSGDAEGSSGGGNKRGRPGAGLDVARTDVKPPSCTGVCRDFARFGGAIAPSW